MTPQNTNLVPQWKARQVILATLFVVAVGLGFWMLYRYRMVILILFTAIILGMALRPAVDRLMQLGISRSLSLGLVYSLILISLGLAVWMLVPVLVTQGSELIISLPNIYQELRKFFLTSHSMIFYNIGMYMPFDIRIVLSKTPAVAQNLDEVGRVIEISVTLLNGILALIAVFLLMSFWILESDRTVANLLLYIPQRYRSSTEELIKSIERRVGLFIRGQFFLCLSIAILALISYLIIGLPNALVLALIAGIFEAIPIFGPALGAVPALLIAYSLEPHNVIWVIVSTVTMQGLENYLLVPRIMGKSVGVNPIITLLVMVTFSSLLGLPGALLAIPFAAIFQLLMDRLVLSRDLSSRKILEGRGVLSALRYELFDLVGDVRKQLRKKDDRSNEEVDRVEDEIENIAAQLDQFLEDIPAGDL